MRRTKRLTKPIVLLALTWTLLGETGCTKGVTNEAEPPGASPHASDSATNLPTNTPVGNDDAVANVNGERITRQQLIDQLMAAYGEQTLQSLMLRVAIKQEAQNRHLQVKDEQIDYELRKMSRGYDSEEQFYSDRERQLGVSRDELRQETKYRLLLEQIATAAVRVSEQDIDTYIEGHPEEFSAETKLRISHLVVSKRQEAEDLLARLEQGEDFAKLVASYSSDADTADDGGNLGWVEENDTFVDDKLLAAASKLDVGDASGPIRTKSGYEIVLLTGRRTPPQENKEQMRDDARLQAALEKAPALSEVESSLLDKYRAQVLDSSLKS